VRKKCLKSFKTINYDRGIRCTKIAASSFNNYNKLLLSFSSSFISPLSNTLSSPSNQISLSLSFHSSFQHFNPERKKYKTKKISSKFMTIYINKYMTISDHDHGDDVSKIIHKKNPIEKLYLDN
jgi:hypothetical protein